jgi:hypothetical protein
MNCPADIASILLSILSTALLRARAGGWSGEAESCALEADHVHNLPDLLGNFSPAVLRYYWEAERTAFIDRSAAAGRSTAPFEPLWERLRPHVVPSSEPAFPAGRAAS